LWLPRASSDYTPDYRWEYSNPTWERLISEYSYFADYDLSNWSEIKSSEHWYIHFVIYSTKFNNKITDQNLGGFIINGKKTVSVNDALLYFKESIMLSEEREYSTYPTQEKARVLELIKLLESGNVTDISFSNGRAFLWWMTNKIAIENEFVFIGTFIVADVALKKKDGTESTYESFAFYTTPYNPIAPYQYDKPYYHYR